MKELTKLYFSRLYIFLWILFFDSGAYCHDFVKVDCFPEPGASQEACLSRGCKWTASTVPDEPWCYFSYEPSKFAGYTVTNVTLHTKSCIEATLGRLPTPSLYGGEDETVKLKINVMGEDMLNIEFENEAPRSKHLTYHMKRIQKAIRKSEKRNIPAKNSFLIDINKNPFGIRITRAKTGEAVFDTFNISGFTHADQFLSITTRTPTKFLYGFGENVHKTLSHETAWKKWGMFTRDHPSGGSAHNLYGVHAFHIGMEKKGNAYGIFLVNSNAQSVQFSPDPSITYRTIGGNLNFVVFMGPSPEEVVQQYNKLIGYPTLPPYWALGFHLCRFGYKSTDDVRKVFDRNQRAGIPQDVQWVDIDYMEKMRDFTYDQKNFNKLPEFTKLVKKSGIKVVLIIEPAIPSNISGQDYQPLVEGLEKNVFILDSKTKKPIQGQVWPGACFFADWTNQNTTKWWTEQLHKFHNSVPFDGVWLDMNEPANFVHGSTTGCPKNKWNNPPYVPLLDQNINTKTLCMDSIHKTGLHYDLHSLSGLLQSASTHIAMLELFPQQRPFILSRSTFSSSGTYAFHWTGDNTSDWPDLEWSIIASIEFNFFGIPFVGADICGFNKNSQGGNATEELCTRWMQLGAFYPFSRNHNSDDKTDQDPAVWSDLSKNSSRNVLLIRYKFLPYLYSLLWQSHIHGTAVMRPLFFEFPLDFATYEISDQFLWGSGLMIVPILRPGVTSRKVYFPTSRWFVLQNGSEVILKTENRSIDIKIGQYEIGLFVQGGTILPWQEPAKNTDQSRKNPLGLLVALDNRWTSNGFLFWDDGISTTSASSFSLFSFHATKKSSNNGGSLHIQRSNYGYKDDIKLDTIQIYGCEKAISTVKLNDVTIPTSHLSYDADNKVLSLKKLQLDIFKEERSTNIIDWLYS